MTDIYQIRTALATTSTQLFESTTQAFGVFAGRTIELVQLISNQMHQDNNVALAVVTASNAVFITFSLLCGSKLKKSINEEPIAIQYGQHRIELPLLSALGVGASVTILNFALVKTFQYSLSPFALAAWAAAGCVAHIFKNCKMVRVIDRSAEIEKLKDQLAANQIQVNQLEKAISQLETEKKGLLSQDEAKHQTIQNLEKELVSSQGNLLRMQSKLETTQNSLNESETKNASMKADHEAASQLTLTQIENLLQEKQRVIDESEELKTKIAQLEKKMPIPKEANRQRTEGIDTWLQASGDSTEITLEYARNEIDTLRKENLKLRGELDASRAKELLLNVSLARKSTSPQTAAAAVSPFPNISRGSSSKKSGSTSNANPDLVQLTEEVAISLTQDFGNASGEQSEQAGTPSRIRTLRPKKGSPIKSKKQKEEETTTTTPPLVKKP